MKDYKYILFDFDGTIVDTGNGIKKSIKNALDILEFEIENEDFLNKFIGPPLTESFKDFCNFNEEKIQNAIKLYREDYRETGMYINESYEGMEELLKSLKEKNKKIILATSKPEFFAKKILESRNLLKYFDFIGGSTLDNKRNSKIEVMDYVIKSCSINNLSEAVMIGDRKFDILGAKHFGIDSVGVLFGYGSIDELKKAGADYIAKDTDELKKIIL